MHKVSVGTATPAIFDSGTSLIMIPSIIYFALTSELLKGIKSAESGGSIYVSCDPSIYNSVYFLIGGYWIEIPPTSFLMNVVSSTTNPQCILGFAPSSMGFFLLGDPIFKTYYIIHDNAGGKIGLVP